MVSLSSVSGSGASLYLEIRQIELQGAHSDAIYQINGMVGDSCDEALIYVELGSSPRVEIVPICNEDGSGDTLDERIGSSELKRLIFEALAQIYFCLEPVPGHQVPDRVVGYADGGRLFRLPEADMPSFSVHRIAEDGPFWQAA